MERLIVVSYDIPSNRRRRKVAELLEGYGQRVQYSVFECRLSEGKLAELQKRLQKRIKMAEDSVRFYPIPPYALGQIIIWGGRPLAEPPGSTVA
ncbi:CRISPR-associated protein Cas2 [Gloeomargarita lithophora Alchichica-D10]|uniref:CRISPR-associated endoribonuclease Cas2 n=1 Tax=Gloeomargarita lithophora Alchichica-D10 TaxID=1188229 RepID=A0A1J0AAG6_9CYAN|nr:CRISPR-associated endonuclease Cas2 [Gloeomargarita lithophora]APB32936.1 CRISPR-associated protein Cas2 [Gloeomargarita lithophora Alchichica-D10]